MVKPASWKPSERNGARGIRREEGRERVRDIQHFHFRRESPCVFHPYSLLHVVPILLPHPHLSSFTSSSLPPHSPTTDLKGAQTRPKRFPVEPVGVKLDHFYKAGGSKEGGGQEDHEAALQFLGHLFLLTNALPASSMSPLPSPLAPRRPTAGEGG